MVGAGAVALALAVVFPLAAIQLWPTARLAGLAAGQRDFEYLSGFASTPFHMVNFVAPGFFHRSPLWRPLVWDPFHTSPEELMPYIGLVPLFLAIVAIWSSVARRPGRAVARDRFHRHARLEPGTLCAGVSPVDQSCLAFRSSGPPRAGCSPRRSRLAMLAGKGFDGWARLAEARPLAPAVRAGGIAWHRGVVGLIELALLCTATQGWPMLARGFQRGFDAMPWQGDPSFAAVMAGARGPAADPRIPAGLNRSRFLQDNARRPEFCRRSGERSTCSSWERPRRCWRLSG